MATSKQSLKRLLSCLKATVVCTIILICVGFSATGIYMIARGSKYGWLTFVFFGVAASFLVHEIISARRRRKEVHEDGVRVSDEELSAMRERAEREAKITVELAKTFTPESKPDEPTPPWLKYPNLSAFHIGWRMGDGESYIGSEFGPFWATLDQTQREDYFRRYDLGEEWPDRSNWYVSWVDYDVQDQ